MHIQYIHRFTEDFEVLCKNKKKKPSTKAKMQNIYIPFIIYKKLQSN